jgi:HD-GYP domain-containing protein (c-di-GMP phosphodiesterase class II)
MGRVQKKTTVVVGEPLPKDIYSSDGSVLVVRAGTIVTREMVSRLANWIMEEEPRLPVEREKRVVNTVNRDTILKKLEFDQIVSEKTRKELEKGVDNLFKNIGKVSKKLNIAELEDAVSAMVEETPDNPDVPLKLSELKKHATQVFNHSVECGIIASFVATSLNYPAEVVTSFSLSMMFHDIGMLSLPSDILDMNRPLTQEEWQLIRQHPRLGWDILKNVPGIEPLNLMIAIGHHVKADGTGYPDEIEFNDLPPLVHLAVIINHFEALTSSRPYRRSYSMHDTIKLMLETREVYHPAVLESFIKVVGIYPISTFVRLNTGEIGVVVRNNPENLFLPEIKLVMDPASKLYSREIVVNLLSEPVRKIVKVAEKV